MRRREAPGLDQRTDLGEHVERPAGIPSAESHSILLRAGEVRDRHDVLRTAGELDELRQDTTAGDVERQVDTIGDERSYPTDEALPVCHGLGAERAQVVLAARTGRADHAYATRNCELDCGAADAARRAVDEQRTATLDAHLVERTRGCLDGGRQRGGGSEVERGWNRCVVRQHRQFGLRRAVGADAEHPSANCDVRDPRAQLVDNPSRFVAQSLRELGIHQALALLPVAQADASGAHRNPHLVGTWMRLGEIDDLQDFRAPELAEASGLHHSYRSQGLADAVPVRLPDRRDPIHRATTSPEPPGRATPDVFRECLSVPRGSADDAPVVGRRAAIDAAIGVAGAPGLARKEGHVVAVPAGTHRGYGHGATGSVEVSIEELRRLFLTYPVRPSAGDSLRREVHVSALNC